MDINPWKLDESEHMDTHKIIMAKLIVPVKLYLIQFECNLEIINLEAILI